MHNKMEGIIRYSQYIKADSYDYSYSVGKYEDRESHSVGEYKNHKKHGKHTVPDKRQNRYSEWVNEIWSNGKLVKKRAVNDH